LLIGDIFEFVSISVQSLINYFLQYSGSTWMSEYWTNFRSNKSNFKWWAYLLRDRLYCVSASMKKLNLQKTWRLIINVFSI